MATEINLPPVGMTTAAGAARVAVALEDFQQASMNVAQCFSRLWDEYDFTDAVEPPQIAEANDLVEIRRSAQDELCRAISGFPPAEEVTE